MLVYSIWFHYLFCVHLLRLFFPSAFDPERPGDLLLSRLPSLEDGREPFLPEPAEMANFINYLHQTICSVPDLNNYLLSKHGKAINKNKMLNL